VITLALAGFMIVGSLTSIASTATDAPDLTLKEPIPAPAGYSVRLDDPAQDSTRTYRSKPISVKTANQAVAEANQSGRGGRGLLHRRSAPGMDGRRPNGRPGIWGYA
jgi:hypothetical protein